MTPKLRVLGRPRQIAIVAMLAFASACASAWAQDDDDDDDDANARRLNVLRGAMIQQAANVDQVDQWVFGRFGGTGGARLKLDSSLSLRIDHLVRTCGLSEDQKRKLKLAGRGDIKRFFDKVEDVKRKFQQGQNAPTTNIWQEIQPLQVELNTGLFGDDSIYAKTIRRTLDGDQAARFETLTRERKRGRYRSTVEWFVVHLDKGLGLTEDQRQQFIELLMGHAHPPRKFGQADFWYLMLQTSRLPEASLKPIFDAPQWRLLSRQFAQARGMEPLLKSNGVFPDDASP